MHQKAALQRQVRDTIARRTIEVSSPQKEYYHEKIFRPRAGLLTRNGICADSKFTTNASAPRKSGSEHSDESAKSIVDGASANRFLVTNAPADASAGPRWS